MNYYDFFKKTRGNRDSVFELVLNGFIDGKSLNILEIGASRNLTAESRSGDGWSSLHFLDYISKNGGSLTIADIDKNALDNCEKLLLSHPNISNLDIKLCLGLGDTIISDKYNFIYLDGGDAPSEMTRELSLIDLSKVSVLCDDFHKKGIYVKYAFPNHILFKWKNNPHEMAFYHEKKTETITLIPIQ